MQGNETPPKRKTTDFVFSPRLSRNESPDLKHFTTERHKTKQDKDDLFPPASTHSITMATDETWLDFELDDNDDEPIGKRKRISIPPSPPSVSQLDLKRQRQEPASSSRNATPHYENKFTQWKPHFAKQLEAIEDVSFDFEGAFQNCEMDGPLITGLEEQSLQSDPKFSFLQPDRIRDAKGRRPDDQGYDPTTIFVPPSWFEANKITAAQRQWWDFKTTNFDSVLVFKVGKFYEMFEMDARIGVEVLGLKYMKGDRPHCGFPESAFTQMAAGLAEKGYKVAVIEQTETPDQLKQRNQDLKDKGRSAEKVVKREKVAVISKGTWTDPEMTALHSEANYLMSICCEINPDGTVFGFCAVDVASNQILFSQRQDDELFTQLRTQISMLDPVEYVLPSSGTETESLMKLVKECTPSARVNVLPFGYEGFADANTSACLLASYFCSESGKERPSLPNDIKELLKQKEENGLCLAACGSVIQFLKKAMLDEAVIPLSKFQCLSFCNAQKKAREGFPFLLNETFLKEPEFVVLDSTALENLEIFKDSDGKVHGSLFAFLDYCKTPFGKRLLKTWLGKPLMNCDDILKRQDAVEDMLTVAARAVGKMRNELAEIGDLERSLVRLRCSSRKDIHLGRESDHVVLYEDVNKKKVSSLVSALRGLQKLDSAVSNFEGVLHQLKSPLLKDLVTSGKSFPIMEDALEALFSAADWEEAQTTGRILPSPGVVLEYDTIKDQISKMERQLDVYFNDLRKKLGARGSSDVSKAPMRKERVLIEVADGLTSRIPSDFELVSRRKGFKRFTTPHLKSIVQELQELEDKFEHVLNGVLYELLQKFASYHETWCAAVEAVANLDALASLAIGAVSVPGSCRPKILRDSETSAPIFKATQLRHPNLIVKGSFVPNDVQLGGEEANFMVLTGANMGGKSTLLRQVCLATILAQIGAWVPAASMEWTPVDTIFVRMGARDRIVCGQSTFFVELSETASMLKNATRRSLVALDELGRGTATTDGEAIAYAVLDYLSSVVGCRGVFATHYHALARDFASNPRIALRHMACQLVQRNDTTTIQFLYKLAEGVAPKSYGMNVARLAGLDSAIVDMATNISSKVENA